LFSALKSSAWWSIPTIPSGILCHSIVIQFYSGIIPQMSAKARGNWMHFLRIMRSILTISMGWRCDKSRGMDASPPRLELFQGSVFLGCMASP
jgi:hypothetical protein